MQIIETESGNHVTIMPGEYYVSNRKAMIRTLLGSCVAACLFDSESGVIGMNHFLLSNRRYAKNLPVCLSEAGRYGMHAMELLINEMMQKGANRRNLRAKAFGGSTMHWVSATQDNFFCVGNVNVRFIREFLKNEDIPLISEDLGGEITRVIHFMPEDYSVHVRKIRKISASAISQEERQFWKESIDAQESTKPQVDLWE
jgi:chemotaxis protein CheD